MYGDSTITREILVYITSSFVNECCPYMEKLNFSETDFLSTNLCGIPVDDLKHSETETFNNTESENYGEKA